jgi:hypothetical protein
MPANFKSGVIGMSALRKYYGICSASVSVSRCMRARATEGGNTGLSHVLLDVPAESRKIGGHAPANHKQR